MNCGRIKNWCKGDLQFICCHHNQRPPSQCGLQPVTLSENVLQLRVFENQLQHMSLK